MRKVVVFHIGILSLVLIGLILVTITCKNPSVQRPSATVHFTAMNTPDPTWTITP